MRRVLWSGRRVSCWEEALAQTLLDQALFAAQHDQWGDVPDLAQRIVLAAEEVDAACMRQRGLSLAQQAEEKEAAQSRSLRQAIFFGAGRLKPSGLTGISPYPGVVIACSVLREQDRRVV